MNSVHEITALDARTFEGRHEKLVFTKGGDCKVVVICVSWCIVSFAFIWQRIRRSVYFKDFNFVVIRLFFALSGGRSRFLLAGGGLGDGDSVKEPLWGKSG